MGEPFGGIAEVTRPDEDGVDWLKALLDIARPYRRRFDQRGQAFVGPLSPQVANEEEGEKYEGDREEYIFLNDVEEVEDDGENSGDNAGDGVPVECEQSRSTS